MKMKKIKKKYDNDKIIRNYYENESQIMITNIN